MMSQEHEVQRLEARAVREQPVAKTPHERAMDRHEAAVEAWQATAARAAEMVLAAEREVGESLTELARYEKQPGIALPVADQRRIEDRMVVTRQRMAQIRVEGR
jgi:hypothetical protein